ncbi:hypothetical protein ACSBR2_013863 [Camellia fascicularis]
MANDEWKEKVGDDIPTGSGKHFDPNVGKIIAMKKQGVRIPEKKTSARKATDQRNQTEAGIITRTTSRYGKINACGGTKR